MDDLKTRSYGVSLYVFDCSDHLPEWEDLDDVVSMGVQYCFDSLILAPTMAGGYVLKVDGFFFKDVAEDDHEQQPPRHRWTNSVAAPLHQVPGFL